MHKQWKIHRSWHIAAVMRSSLVLGHFFEPKARNNNHQFPIRLDFHQSWIFMDSETCTDIILSKKQNPHGQHWQQNCNTNTTNCVICNLCKKCMVVWTPQCGVDEKFTRSLTTLLGHCCLKESRRAAFWGSNPKILKCKDIFFDKLVHQNCAALLFLWCTDCAGILAEVRWLSAEQAGC